MPGKMWDEITYPFPNFNSCTTEVWEQINNFISHFMMDVITYQCWDQSYRKVSNISRTSLGNKIVDHSDVVRALPVGAAPTTTSFST